MMESSIVNQRGSSRLTTACINCRDRKVKCGGDNPCKNCLRQKKTCSYPPSRRGKRMKIAPATNAGQLSNLTSDQLARTGTLDCDTQVAAVGSGVHNGNGHSTYRPASVLPPTPSYSSSGTCDGQSRQTNSRIHFAPEPSELSEVNDTRSNSTAALYHTFSTSVSGATPLPQSTQTNYQIHEEIEVDAAGAAAGPVDGEESVIPLQRVNQEHHGPWSWVSICSQPGLKWVCERTRTDDFIEIANGLTKTWSRRLKMQRFQNVRDKGPEIHRTTVWRYVAAYFDQSWDAAFGIIHRPTFETRLRIHFNHQTPGQSEDPSWFALRNIVCAIGCRCLLANNSSVSFVDANSQASRFFQNALSVFAEISFGHSGFTAVQALALMACFAEGLGSPALEYPLCTNAVHLAQAKGLHREASKSWGLSELDYLNRNWLWWAIYCMEKQIAFRSGRPSVIDDDNISTRIPTSAPPGSGVDVRVFTLMIQHAQISARISSRIMSVKAFKQPPSQTIETANDIQRQLQHLLSSVPQDLRVETSLRNESSTGPRRIHSIYLHFAIHGSLMATNIVFFYPWISKHFGTESDPEFRSLAVKSAETIANAARQIMLVLRSLTVDAAVPAWLAFYYPMYAHINLFIFSLQYPSLSTSALDLALLDICAGHFGHVEQVTSSEIAFHFPRESAALGARFVKSAKGKEEGIATVSATPQLGPVDVVSSTNNTILPQGANCGRPSSSLTPYEVAEGDPFGAMNFDMEDWNIFSTIDITDNNDTMFGTFNP